MELEQRFRVRLPDTECQRARTVADLAALVLTHLPTAHGACATARRFYKLRAGLCDVTGAERRAIRPGTRLESLFPREGRRRRWARLRARDPDVLRLHDSARLDAGALLICGAGVFVWIVVIGGLALRHGALIVLPGIAVMVAALAVMSRLSMLLATGLPAGCESVADLVRLTTPMEMPENSGERLVRELEVLDTVRGVVAEQLGFAVDDVKPSSRLVEDLGVG